jgi:hypothetical protein
LQSRESVERDGEGDFLSPAKDSNVKILGWQEKVHFWADKETMPDEL